MTDTVSLTFTVNATDSTAELGFEAWVDDEKFVDINHVEHDHQIKIDLLDDDDDGERELRLVLKGKTQAHTRIDESGNIVSDARLSISNMAFDEVELGHMVTKQSVYTHSLNTHFQTTMQDRFYGEMGYNGTVSLKFTTPIYLWLLENM